MHFTGTGGATPPQPESPRGRGVWERGAGMAPPAEAAVVVVGAGLAGLRAAGALEAALGPGGGRVVVVEAGAAVGGRVRDLRGVAPGPVQLGAEFLHGNEHSLLCDQLEVRPPARRHPPRAPSSPAGARPRPVRAPGLSVRPGSHNTGASASGELTPHGALPRRRARGRRRGGGSCGSASGRTITGGAGASGGCWGPKATPGWTASTRCSRASGGRSASRT